MGIYVNRDGGVLASPDVAFACSRLPTFCAESGRPSFRQRADPRSQCSAVISVVGWLTKRVGPSLLVAALFALHPLNVESVAWVAERKNVLSTLFFLLAIGAYVWYAQKPGGGDICWCRRCLRQD